MRLRALAPARGGAGKEPLRMPVRLPPRAQLRDHRGRQRHEAILAALATAHMQTRMRRVRLAQVAQLDAHRLAHAQPGVIDERERRAITRFPHRAQQRRDLLARENERQRLRRRHAHLVKHRPVRALQTLAEESAQGTAGQLHGRAAELLLLAQKEKVGAQLILRERGRVALKMFAQLAQVADVFLFGRPAKIFEFDKGGKLGQRGTGNYHRRRACPRVRPHARRQNQKNSRPPGAMKTRGPPENRQARRRAAGFNQCAAANAAERLWLSASITGCFTSTQRVAEFGSLGLSTP